MNRIVRLYALLLVVPLMMGATCTLTEVTPNPGGAPNRLDMNGSYSLGQNEFLLYISAGARLLPTEQITFNTASVDQQAQTWNVTLHVAPGEYECLGILHYHTGNPAQPLHKGSNKITKTVQ